MKHSQLRPAGKLISIAITLVTMLLLTVSIAARPAFAQTQNLLLNGDFEEGYSQAEGFDEAWIAVGWEPFAVTTDLDIPNNPTGSQPVYLASDSTAATENRVLTGARSQMWRTSYSSAFAGVSQRIPIPTDSTVRLSAWTYGWSSTGDDPTVSQNAAWMRQRIGIDPTGGNDPNSPDIVWSPAAQYIDTWGELAIEATATENHVTVYLSAYPNFVLPNNEVYFDNAQLTLVAFNLPTPAPDYGVAGDEVPGAAPTVDPLLIGLVTGQGVTAGQQGILLNGKSATDAQAVEQSANRSAVIPLSAIIGSIILTLATALTLAYLLKMQFEKQKAEKLKMAKAIAKRSSMQVPNENPYPSHGNQQNGE
ncbi:MAG: hypothetical protein AB8G95_03845 [Anaerolineae bacterium]